MATRRYHLYKFSWCFVWRFFCNSYNRYLFGVFIVILFIQLLANDSTSFTYLMTCQQMKWGYLCEDLTLTKVLEEHKMNVDAVSSLKNLKVMTLFCTTQQFDPPKDMTQFPEDILVVCHQNFTSFYGPFSLCSAQLIAGKEIFIKQL